MFSLYFFCYSSSATRRLAREKLRARITFEEIPSDATTFRGSSRGMRDDSTTSSDPTSEFPLFFLHFPVRFAGTPRYALRPLFALNTSRIFAYRTFDETQSHFQSFLSFVSRESVSVKSFRVFTDDARAGRRIFASKSAKSLAKSIKLILPSFVRYSFFDSRMKIVPRDETSSVKMSMESS